MTEPVEKVTGVTVDGVVAVHVYTCPSVVYTAVQKKKKKKHIVNARSSGDVFAGKRAERTHSVGGWW